MQITSLKKGWSRVVTLVTRPVAVSTLAASGQKQSQLWQTTDLVIVAGWLSIEGAP